MEGCIFILVLFVNFITTIIVGIFRFNWGDPMAKIGDIGPLRPVWPQKPQDKLDPKKDPSRKRAPAPEEGGTGNSEHDGDDVHIDDYA